MGRYDTGFLTDTDRAYLRGEMDPGKDEGRNVRYRIRERVKGALRDLELVEASLPETDRAKVFDDLYEEESGSAIATLSLLYLSAGDRFGATGEASNEIALFEHFVEAGIQLAERKEGHLASVDADIDVDRRQPDRSVVKERVEEGEATLEEFLYLGRIDQFAILDRVVDTDQPLALRTTSRDEDVMGIEIPPDVASGILEDGLGRRWRE